VERYRCVLRWRKCVRDGSKDETRDRQRYGALSLSAVTFRLEKEGMGRVGPARGAARCQRTVATIRSSATAPV
jgi:hypothetical protein